MTPPLPDRLADPPEGASVERALKSPTRAGIYEHLRRAGDGLTVRDIAASFELHPNVARTHLELLADAGLVVVGSRKHPGGGRPAKVYIARDEVAAELAPAHAAGLRGAGAPGAALVAKLLVHLVEACAPLDPRAVTVKAHEVGAAEGRRLFAASATRAPGFPATAQAVAAALRSHAPDARVARSGTDWAELTGVRGIFRVLDPIRPELADAFERGLVVGAFAAAGAAVNLADGAASAGGRGWRVQVTAPASGRPQVAPATTVDARGLAREAGVVAAMRTVTGLRPGEVLEVLAEGPGSPAAFARWADRAGHVLLGVERATDTAGRPAIRMLIRKGR